MADRREGLLDTAAMTTFASPAVIRQWARDNGIAVGDRGRLNPDVVAAYAAQKARAAVGGAVVAGDRADAAMDANGGRPRLSVRPTPGATGISRRVRARAS